jgi:hypothetical protein
MHSQVGQTTQVNRIGEARSYAQRPWQAYRGGARSWLASGSGTAFQIVFRLEGLSKSPRRGSPLQLLPQNLFHEIGIR